VGRIRGWPVTIIEPALLDAPVVLRPVRMRDARVWRDSRVRNAHWLRPWEPTNPETPLYRSSVGPYVGMARTMRREARQGLALPWVVLYDGRFAGQLTVGSIMWGSARSGQVGYWVDEAFAGRGVGTALVDQLLRNLGALGIERVRTEVGWEEHELARFLGRRGFAPLPRLVLEASVVAPPERE